MTDGIDLGLFDIARKDTVAVLDGVAITLPELKEFRPNGSVNDVGIPKPTAAPTAAAGGAGNPNGAYIYKAAHKDTSKGYFGQGSDTFSVSVTNQSIDIDLTPITNENDHSEVDALLIYRSLAGGTVLFLVAEVAHPLPANFNDDASDASISVNDTLPVAEQAYKVPVKDTFGWNLKGKDRLFNGGPADYHDDTSLFRNQLHWTPIEPNAGIPFPLAYPDENVVTVENDGRPLRGATMIGDFMALFEDNDILMFVWIDDPDGQTGNGNIEPMGVGRGANTFKSIVNADGAAWIFDRQGFYRYEGGQRVSDVTEPIIKELGRINWREVAQFHGTFDDKRLYWFVALDGESENRYCFILDRKSIQGGKGIRWWLYFLPQGARDSTSYITGASAISEEFNLPNTRVAQIITTEGYEQIIKEGIYLDGVHPDFVKQGVIAGASDQVFQVTGANYQINDATLAGAYVVFDDPQVPEPLAIASSTGEFFTLVDQTPGAIVIAAGTPFKLGFIKGLWRSGQLDTGGPETMKKYRQLAVVVNPMPGEGELRALTRQHRLGPFVAGKTETNRTGYELNQFKPGANIKTGGRLRGTGNKVGYTEVPIIGRDGRYVSVEFQDEDCLPWELVGYYVQAVPFVVDK